LFFNKGGHFKINCRFLNYVAQDIVGIQIHILVLQCSNMTKYLGGKHEKSKN